MKFFIFSCLFCLVVASVGCMTNNWSSPLFQDGETIEDTSILPEEEPEPNFWNSRFGTRAGVDARAVEIEKRLGF